MIKQYFDKFLKIFGVDSGRKYTLVVLCVVLNSIMVWCNVIPDMIYRDIILGVVLVYISGNVAQDVMSKDKGNYRRETKRG